jgi:phage terminase large subunit GpA-like protein
MATGGRIPDGFIHIPLGTTAEWIKQLTAEQLVTIRGQRGFAKLEWRQLRERNEALDCRVYARAAAWIAGTDRWTDAAWRNLERQVGITADTIEDQQAQPASTPVDNIAGMIRRGPPRMPRRVFRSSYMT